MTIPKVTTKTKYGERWYVDPVLNTDRPGVSSIVNQMPKPALTPWAAKMAAEFAVANIESLYKLVDIDPAAAIDLIKGAPWRSSGTAADNGTEVHHYTELIARAIMAGEKPSFSVPKDVMPYLKQYARFLKEFDVEPVLLETTVIHTEPGQDYMGTFDFLGRLRALGDDLVIVDTKSGASGVWPSSAIQQTGYRYAESYWDGEAGELKPMPPVAATFGLWLRPEGFALIPLESTEAELEQWRRLRGSLEWKNTREKKVVAPAINRVPLKRKPKWQKKRP